MNQMYQLEIGESPVLYITKTGALTVGMDCLISNLDFPSIIKPARALANRGLRGRQLHIHDLVPRWDVQLAIGSREVTKLTTELIECPMFSAHVEVDFKKCPPGKFELTRETSLTLSVKKRLLHRELENLLQHAILLRVAFINKVREKDLVSLYQSQFSAVPYPRLVLTREALNAQWQSHPTLGEEGASLVLDFIPFVGTVKAVAEAIAGKDLITQEKENRWILAADIALSLIPLGKIIEKTIGRAGGFIVKKMDQLSRRSKLKKGEIEGFNFTGKTTGTIYPINNSGGKYGTFITDRKHIEKAIGPVKTSKKTVEISVDQAKQLAKNLGISEDAVMSGGVLNVISRVPERMPKKPVGGNQFFKTGGLKNYGPELTIHPIPTAGGGGIKQVNVRVVGVSDAEKKRLSRDFTRMLKKK